MNKTKKIVLCGLFAALTAVGAFIKIPLPMVSVTLQTMFTMYAAVILGSRTGAAAVAVYVAAGLAGIPVFSEGGGIWYVLKPSFGYLPGFIGGTFITGYIIEKMKKTTFPVCMAANLAGLAFIYVVGMSYFYFISSYVMGNPIATFPFILNCCIMMLPGDLCSSAVVALTAGKIKRIIGKGAAE